MKKFILIFLGCVICSSLFPDEYKHKATNIYFAGPLFTIAERQFNAELTQKLRDLGHTVFLPQESEIKDAIAKDIFNTELAGLDNSDIIVAIFDGADLDSGTSWECGYGYAKNKPIIAVRTDFRKTGDLGFAPYNLMLSESANKHVHLSCLECDLEKLVHVIDQQLQNLYGEK